MKFAGQICIESDLIAKQPSTQVISYVISTVIIEMSKNTMAGSIISAVYEQIYVKMTMASSERTQETAYHTPNIPVELGDAANSWLAHQA